MEIDTIYYKAKDGRIFTDPLECESYEKTIGILPGSVGDLINDLEKHDMGEYVFAFIYVSLPDKKIINTFTTLCLDDYLETYVNVNDLREDQRYVSFTIGQMIEVLSKYDKDAMCQYMISYSNHLNMSNPGIMANYNKSVWKE